MEYNTTVIDVRDDTDISAYAETRDWRTYFAKKLWGTGIDIGALHRPMVKHDAMNVKYVDRLNREELRKHYPELYKYELVEADIIDDAQLLMTIGPEELNFVIAAHVIEHMPSPLLAIEHWLRVLKVGGLLYLVIPDKRKIFDSLRVRTTLAHIVADYAFTTLLRDVDFEHALDYAIHVDKKSDPNEAIDHATQLMITGYSYHFHVFLPIDIANMLKWFNNNIQKIKILEGPIMGKDDSEFHVLIEKI